MHTYDDSFVLQRLIWTDVRNQVMMVTLTVCWTVLLLLLHMFYYCIPNDLLIYCSSKLNGISNGN